MRQKRESTVPSHRAAVANAERLLTNERVRGYLAAQRHPLPWRHELGETLLEWTVFQFTNGSVSGQAEAVREVRDAVRVLGIPWAP